MRGRSKQAVRRDRSRLFRVWDKRPSETTGATSMRPFRFADRFAGPRLHWSLGCLANPGPRLCRAPTRLHTRPLSKGASADSSPLPGGPIYLAAAAPIQAEENAQAEEQPEDEGDGEE